MKSNTHYELVLYVIILSCFLTYTYGAASDTIRANESLRWDSQPLISSGNRFKLSFFSPPNSSHRYVGIMFNLPVMTVVWVANRDSPLNDSSATFQISSDGNIVILDGRKAIVWSTNLSSPVPNSRAVLLDTGNLVLQDTSNTGYFLWESFQHASDSFLEKMRLYVDLSKNERNILSSWRSPDDPAPGSFVMTVEPDIPQSYVLKDGNPYWRSGPWNGQRFIGLPGMTSLYNDGTNVGSDSPGTAYYMYNLPNSSVLLYFVLNSSGSIEKKEWSNEKREWDVTWSSTRNECDAYGRCGSFGSCNARERPICSCFRGFVAKRKDEWEAGNWSSGCTRRTPLQCEEKGSVGKQDDFVVVEGVNLPDHFTPLPVGDCRGACLSNCSCVAYSEPSGIGCMHWTLNLTDTQKFTYGYGGEDLFLRLAYSELHKKQDRRAIIVTTVILGFILIVVCTYLCIKFFNYRGKKHRRRLLFSLTMETGRGYSEESMLKHDKHGVKLEELRIINFELLSNATEKFNPVNMLGQGGFGPVYKGKLGDGEEIAVKRLARSSNQGVEEFMNEVVVISRLQHRNLVRLVGCCVESEEKMLVYEYMPNGGLDASLFGCSHYLDWQTRKQIIEGICRGLLYLHRDSRLKIIHRDLKASNILLDEEMNPKISDFGMARIFGGKDDQANTTRVVGTYGYMSPEYAHRGIFSEKSDVYSFGVLLLEIVSGKKNSSFYDEEQQLFLTAYAWKLWKEGKVVNLMDTRIKDGGVGVVAVEDDIMRYANVGLLCVQEIAADRPNTSTVLSMLCREIVELPQPKQPAFLGMQSSQATEGVSANQVTISIAQGR